MCNHNDSGVTMVSLFHTLFDVGGFTGVAGWRFSDMLFVNGTGTAADFVLTEDHGRLSWQTNDFILPNSMTTFFFVSTNYPWPFGSKEHFGLVSDTVNGIGLGLAPEYQNPARSHCSDPGWWVSMLRCADVKVQKHSGRWILSGRM